MFLRFFLITVLFSVTLWYLHEYHTAQFMAVTRNIPYLSPLMAKLHSSVGSSGKKDNVKGSEKIYTVEQLSRYNGDENSKGVYIAILGKVFDVKKGKKHYGPGGTYHIFAGRDASRAFVTGEFTEDKASDEVLDLSLTDLLSLKQWVEFYEKDYVYKGKLVGRYFTATGAKTDYHRELEKKLMEAKAAKNNKEEDRRKFPPCNMEWSADKGSRVWCSSRRLVFTYLPRLVIY